MDSIRTAAADDLPAITALLAELETLTDGPPLSEYKMRALRNEVEGETVVGLEADTLVGVAQAGRHPPGSGGAGHWAVEVAAAEPVVTGPELLRACAELLPPREDRLVWSAVPALGAELERLGFHEVRRIERMSMLLPGPSHAFPDRIRLAPFVVDEDEAAWIATNNRAFAGHPENGAVTLVELEGRMGLDWFSPTDLLMAWDGDRLVGSCWTKVHPRRVGEIYIIGVDPDAEGTGLGRALLAAGADHLYRVRRCQRLMLYTDSGNARATRLYRGFGFTTEAVNRQFAFPERSVRAPVG